LNETTPLSTWDLFGIPDANLTDSSGNPIAYFPKNGRFSFFQAQNASLFTWTSSGRSNYKALQLMLRHRGTHGLTFDFNYIYSKSIDMGSDAERVSLFEGSFFGTGEIYNPFDPGLFRAVSDYDMTHQINSNWAYELPLGRQKHWGSGWNRGLDANRPRMELLWTCKMDQRITIRRAKRIGISNQLGTQWFCQSRWAKAEDRHFPDADGDVNMFQNPSAAISAFDFPFPGQVGQRKQSPWPRLFWNRYVIDQKLESYGTAKAVF